MSKADVFVEINPFVPSGKVSFENANHPTTRGEVANVIAEILERYDINGQNGRPFRHEDIVTDIAQAFHRFSK